MKIRWTPNAKQKYRALLLDVRDKDGYRSALKLRKEVTEIQERIKQYPTSAQMELLLEGSKFEFRSVPFGLYNKLIYRIVGEVISIDNLWDTRREPKNQADATIEKTI